MGRAPHPTAILDAKGYFDKNPTANGQRAEAHNSAQFYSTQGFQAKSKRLCGRNS